MIVGMVRGGIEGGAEGGEMGGQEARAAEVPGVVDVCLTWHLGTDQVVHPRRT